MSLKKNSQKNFEEDVEDFRIEEEDDEQLEEGVEDSDAALHARHIFYGGGANQEDEKDEEDDLEEEDFHGRDVQRLQNLWKQMKDVKLYILILYCC